MYDPTIDDSSSAYYCPPSVVGPYDFCDLEIAEVLPTFAELISGVSAGKQLIVGTRVLESFFEPVDGLIVPARPLPTFHAMYCVGVALFTGDDSEDLKDGESLLCVQNSWGDGWGDGGIGYLPRSTYEEAATRVAEIVERYAAKEAA
jgi:hypothetical protein